MIIDAHTHFNPYEMRKLRFSSKEFISVLDRYEIDMAAVSMPFYLESDFILGNRVLKELMDEFPKRIIGIAAIHPLFEKEAEEEIRWAFDNGFKGLKLHADIAHISYDDPLCIKVIEEAGKNNLPITLHTGPSCLSSAQKAASLFPKITFLFGHIGDIHWRETSLWAKEHPNVILDTCGCIFEQGYIETALENVGPERIVYGSDFIYIDPGIMLGIINGLEISSETKKKILGENAKKIFLKNAEQI